MKFFDLFCGAGGLSLGFKLTGFTPTGGLEKKEERVEAYRLNIGVRPLVADAFKLKPKELTRQIDADILLGCPPCQGFSRLRVNRFGPDERNDLVLFFGEVVRASKPPFVVFENVPGVAEDWRFVRLLRILRRLGYAVAYDVIDAVDYGVPQRRRRLVLVASRNGEGRLPEPTHGPPDSPEVKRGVRMPWRTVRDAIGDLPPVEHGKCHPADPLHCAKRLPENWLRLIKAIPKNGGSRFDAPEELWLPAHRRLGRRGFFDVFGRLRWDTPSVTITTGFPNPSKGRFVHPEQDRGLTLREGARLQTFPDDFRFVGSFNEIAAQIGEAFPPLLARRIAETIRGR